MSSSKDPEQEIISYRRSLHRIPELDFDLPKTRAFLLSVLEPLGFEIRDFGKAGFSVFIDSGKAETIAFRSDMDGLAVTEPEGCDFGSEHKGLMHACGHDGHMAMLLGLARKAYKNPEDLPKNSLLIFQAAEEASGGAKIICGTGVLSEYRVSRIYGMHLWPGGAENTIYCRAGEFMAGNSMLRVTIEGKSVHIADYSNGRDALEAGCIFVERAYKFERDFPPDIFRLLRFGEFKSGTASNIVSEKTLLLGTARTYDKGTFKSITSGLRKIMQDIEKETGVSFSFEYAEGYPPVINPKDLYEQTKAVLTDAGFEWRSPDIPYMHTEDFSFYQQKIPGLYMHLGMGGNVKLHSPEYVLNEKTLARGTELMWTLLTDDHKG